MFKSQNSIDCAKNSLSVRMKMEKKIDDPFRSVFSKILTCFYIDRKDHTIVRLIPLMNYCSFFIILFVGLVTSPVVFRRKIIINVNNNKINRVWINNRAQLDGDCFAPLSQNPWRSSQRIRFARTIASVNQTATLICILIGISNGPCP